MYLYVDQRNTVISHVILTRKSELNKWNIKDSQGIRKIKYNNRKVTIELAENLLKSIKTFRALPWWHTLNVHEQLALMDKVFEHGPYDSEWECLCGFYLWGQKTIGVVKHIDRQVRYKLPNFESKRSLEYRADFGVFKPNNELFIIEAKGMLTDANKVKYAYFQDKYGLKIHIVKAKGREPIDMLFLK